MPGISAKIAEKQGDMEMVDCEKLLEYIVNSKLHVKDIADQLKLSEVNFIKRVGNIQDFTVIEVNRLCDILNIKGEDAIRVFFA